MAEQNLSLYLAFSFLESKNMEKYYADRGYWQLTESIVGLKIREVRIKEGILWNLRELGKIRYSAV